MVHTAAHHGNVYREGEVRSLKPTSPHAEFSQLRESITMHAFLGSIGREMWRRGHYDAEILQAEFDAGGYDLVIYANGATRHIQLKTKNLSGRTASWSISQRLAEQPSGCVAVVHIDDSTLAIRQYGLFASRPGHRLPNITEFPPTRHTKADSTGSKAVRKDRYKVPKSRFKVFECVADLYDALFGPE